jgi:hypothetical protein
MKCGGAFREQNDRGSDEDLLRGGQREENGRLSAQASRALPVTQALDSMQRRDAGASP